MISIPDLLEGFHAYKILDVKGDVSKDEITSFVFIFEGVINFDFFSNQIKSLIDPNSKITKINDELILLTLNSNVCYSNRYLESLIKVNNYQVYSIFLKKRLNFPFLDSFNDINSNIFYLYYEINDFTIQYKNPKNATDFKIISSYPKKHFYGFNNFSDLIDFYIELVINDKKWPVFAILPSKANLKPIRCDSNKEDYNFPIFEPINFLYYVSFIEKFQQKPKRMKNVSKIYSINDVQDVQISYLFHPKYNDIEIRTFLGLDTKFRCLQVFDFLLNSPEIKKYSIFDVKLFKEEKILSLCNMIKYNLYYLEIQSLFDSSILFSINFLESFNLFDSIDIYSTFLSFDNQDDFFEAKKYFSSLINCNFILKNIKLLDTNEFSQLFPGIQMNMNLFFIVFRIKNIGKHLFQNLPNLSLLFKYSAFIKKDSVCSLDNKKYITVGFSSIEKRNQAFKTLKKSIYSIKVKGYFPVGMNKIIEAKEILSLENKEEESLNKNIALSLEESNVSISMNESNDSSFLMQDKKIEMLINDNKEVMPEKNQNESSFKSNDKINEPLFVPKKKNVLYLFPRV